METEENKPTTKETNNLKEDIAMQKDSKSKDKKEGIDPKKTEEKKVEDKKSEIKQEPKVKKTEAKVSAKSLPISTKHAMAILNMIRNKNINDAIVLLGLAEKKKIPVPMRGEIPHKKGIMSGRYPVHDLGYVIKVLKSLKSNALVNELELEKYRIFCKANVAARPYRRFGKGKFKRTHIDIKLVPITKTKRKTKKKIKGKK